LFIEISLVFIKNNFSIDLRINKNSDTGPTNNWTIAIKTEEIPPTSPKISKMP